MSSIFLYKFFKNISCCAFIARKELRISNKPGINCSPETANVTKSHRGKLPPHAWGKKSPSVAITMGKQAQSKPKLDSPSSDRDLNKADYYSSPISGALKKPGLDSSPVHRAINKPGLDASSVGSDLNKTGPDSSPVKGTINNSGLDSCSPVSRVMNKSRLDSPLPSRDMNKSRPDSPPGNRDMSKSRLDSSLNLSPASKPINKPRLDSSPGKRALTKTRLDSSSPTPTKHVREPESPLLSSPLEKEPAKENGHHNGYQREDEEDIPDVPIWEEDYNDSRLWRSENAPSVSEEEGGRGLETPVNKRLQLHADTPLCTPLPDYEV
jgi:hypothetical protein